MLIGLLSGCGLFSAKPKEFSESGMTITLTDDFAASENVMAQMYVVSKDHIFMGNGESKSTLSGYGYNNLSLNDYIGLVLSASKKEAEVKSYSDDDTNFLYAYYQSTVEGKDYSYMLICMQGKDKFYAMNLGCFTKNFNDKTKDTYMEWAKTIRVQ